MISYDAAKAIVVENLRSNGVISISDNCLDFFVRKYLEKLEVTNMTHELRRTRKFTNTPIRRKSRN